MTHWVRPFYFLTFLLTLLTPILALLTLLNLFTTHLAFIAPLSANLDHWNLALFLIIIHRLMERLIILFNFQSFIPLTPPFAQPQLVRTFLFVYFKQWLRYRDHWLFLVRNIALLNFLLINDLFPICIVWCLNYFFHLRPFLTTLIIFVPLLDFAILILDCHRTRSFWFVFVNVNFDSLTAFLTFQHFIYTIINETSDNLISIANKPFIIWKILNFFMAL